MSKTETGKIENDKTARVLRDHELDMVSAAANYLKVDAVVGRGYLSGGLQDIIVSS
jgi:hypothetical protein